MGEAVLERSSNPRLLSLFDGAARSRGCRGVSEFHEGKYIIIFQCSMYHFGDTLERNLIAACGKVLILMSMYHFGYTLERNLICVANVANVEMF